MKLVYMGTPDFAVPPLTALVEAGHEVAAVVTQPDKPKGRGKAVLMTPVKEKALSYGIPVYQPARIKKDEEFLKTLREINPDAIVVAAFGQILPKEILELPKYGCVNIHASLLPKYRGAAPIQWAVIDGEKESGITTMMMDVGLDTGDMLDRTVIPLAEDETGGSLFEKLSRAGGPLILKTLEALENGTAVRTKQPEEGATYAGMLDKSLGNIDWTQSAAKIERLIRGLNPWPSAYTGYKGKTMKLWAADVLEGTFEGVPGEIIKVEKERFLVRTGDGALAVKELQLEGKKRMDAASFLRGFSLEEGEILCQG
ncbi:methionyl-tRNA formyltransferase [Clostridium sp. M62/1]|uniref:methionyl-tRNA formyltransferase n=1 Tax=Clostridium sp. M62/1 TaxID=411486 RepID=UPI0001972DCF|nr:methionyl-tRNA formyltransferase [Clostridium sp. M62/1]EFE11884.1 methionyl-tRNA formyltransferase [Clostridium sp. M62/1]MBS5468347.1 methionyl-tRNA formyltransferase [Clostridium sp.]UEB77303.1 methionyl-tRNA formyltransferase [Clostridium sp. M62/1]